MQGGAVICSTWRYQIWAGRSLAQWNKEALRTRLGCGMWAQDPGGLLHPGGRGHGAWVGRAAATNTCQKVFLWQEHPLRWAAEPVLHTEGLHSFFGVFSASALLTRPSPLPLLWGAVFLLPYFHSPPGTFKPQSHWLLVLEHALHVSSTHLFPMIHPPPLAQIIYAKPQTTSRKSPDIAHPILTPVYFSPLPLA